MSSIFNAISTNNVDVPAYKVVAIFSHSMWSQLQASITCSISRSLYEVAALYREEITLMGQKFTAIIREGRASAFNSNTSVFNTYHTNTSAIFSASTVLKDLICSFNLYALSLHNAFRLQGKVISHSIISQLPYSTRRLYDTTWRLLF